MTAFPQLHHGHCPHTGKRAYSTRRTARAAARRHDRALRPYTCVTCGYWHLGHLPADVIHGKVGREIYDTK